MADFYKTITWIAYEDDIILDRIAEKPDDAHFYTKIFEFIMAHWKFTN